MQNVSEQASRSIHPLSWSYRFGAQSFVDDAALTRTITMYCNFLLMFFVATLSVFYSLEATSFHMLCYSQAAPFSLNQSDQLSLARYFCKEPCHCDSKRSSRILLLLVLKKRASCSTNKFYLLILKLLLRLLCLTAYLHLSILMPRARQCQNVIHCSAVSFLWRNWTSCEWKLRALTLHDRFKHPGESLCIQSKVKAAAGTPPMNILNTKYKQQLSLHFAGN